MKPGEGEAEREPRLARRSPWKLEVKLCPKCLTPLRTERSLIGLLPASYSCPKCGYFGSVYVAREPPEEGSN